MRPRQHAYILVLPSLFTTANLFCGFYSIIRSFNHDFERAAYAIFVAGLFDILDGRVARITGSTSKFGLEYDSIADVISFGLAPAILSFIWVLHDFGNFGWAAAFFFTACGALRLARFNTLSDVDTPKSYFLGLPIPIAAGSVAGAAIAFPEFHILYPHLLMLLLMFTLGLLMVSSIRYRSFKDFNLRHKRSFVELVFLVGIIAIAAVKPEGALLILLGYYVIWGVVREVWLWGLKKRHSPAIPHSSRIKSLSGDDK